MIAPSPSLMIALVALMLLSACAQRFGATPDEPQVFAGAEVQLLGRDMIEVTASMLFPIEGATGAYADCIAAGHALKREDPYLSRVLTRTTGRGDLLTHTTTYLLTKARPGGKHVLTARDIVANCRANQFPTE